MKSFAAVLLLCGAAAAIDGSDMYPMSIEVDATSIMCQCQPASHILGELSAAKEMCAGAGFPSDPMDPAFGRSGTSSCYVEWLFAPGSLWGYVAPEEIQAMFDVAEFHGMHESIGNCMVNFPYEAPMDNGVFNWGGDFQWEEYDMAVQAFLECTKGEMLTGCTDWVRDNVFNVCPTEMAG